LNPALAVDGSNIYVVWCDGGWGQDLYFKRSTDRGVTWKTEKLLKSVGDKGSYLTPSIAVDGSNIYVVWNDNSSGNYEIYFKRSTDRGVTWSSDKRLTNSIGQSLAPTIAADGLNIYVGWRDGTPGNDEIYFKKGLMD
jgi:hypothetical protein